MKRLSLDSRNVISTERYWVGESPIWDIELGSVLWIDILGEIVGSWDGKTTIDQKVRPKSQLISAIVKCRNGGYLACGRWSLDLFNSNWELEKRIWEHAEQLGNYRWRLNDAKADAAGRLWFGSTTTDRQVGAAALYCYNRSNVDLICRDVTVSNGIAWSPDSSRMYYVDSPRRTLDVFDYDLKTGKSSNRRVLYDFSSEKGNPDGIAVDLEGGIWVALYGGWRVDRITPTGKLDTRIELPACYVTSCAFIGHESRDMIITTARLGLSEDEIVRNPLSGAVFVIENIKEGLPPYEVIVA